MLGSRVPGVRAASEAVVDLCGAVRAASPEEEHSTSEVESDGVLCWRVYPAVDSRECTSRVSCPGLWAGVVSPVQGA